jgi:hypothetical protein
MFVCTLGVGFDHYHRGQKFALADSETYEDAELQANF